MSSNAEDNIKHPIENVSNESQQDMEHEELVNEQILFS
jgi:hypothetical protein